MLATESFQPGLDRAFHGTSQSVNGAVSEMLRSGNYYTAPDITRELGHIHSGVDHIKLDHAFLQSSSDWANKFGPHNTARQKQGATMVMDKAARTMHGVKGQINSQRMNTLQGNQVRESHGMAVQNLRSIENDMAPYAHQSVDRIKQFCDHMGVSDRYTGYRHNLNRGNRDPVRRGYSWLENSQPYSNQAINRCPRVSSAVPTKCTTEPQTHSRYATSAPVRKTTEATIPGKSIQEQCGINMTFPGKTEYMKRYIRPEPTPNGNFVINPTPDFGLCGRPLDRPNWSPNHTEYQTRYAWPDATNAVKLPWLRK